MYKIVEDMPEEGQFIMVWEFDNVVWSSVMRWEGEKLLTYKRGTNEWEQVDSLLDHLDGDCTNIRFIMIGYDWYNGG